MVSMDWQLSVSPTARTSRRLEGHPSQVPLSLGKRCESHQAPNHTVLLGRTVSRCALPVSQDSRQGRARRPGKHLWAGQKSVWGRRRGGGPSRHRSWRNPRPTRRHSKGIKRSCFDRDGRQLTRGAQRKQRPEQGDIRYLGRVQSFRTASDSFHHTDAAGQGHRHQSSRWKKGWCRPGMPSER